MKQALSAIIILFFVYVASTSPLIADEDHFTLARTCENAGRYREAVAGYRDTIAQATNDSVRLESTRGIIRIELKLGDYAAIARTLIRAELDISDKSSTCQVIYISDLKPEQQKKLAVALESAMSSRNGLPITRLLLADLLIHINKIDKARPLIEQAHSDAENDLAALRYACRVSNTKAFRDQALEIAKQLVEIESETPSNSVNKAEKFMSNDMAKEAVDQADQTLLKWPNDTWAAMRLPEVYVRFKAWDKAINAWNHAISLIPDFAESARLRLAEAHEANHQPAEAISLYEMLLRNTSNDSIKSLCLDKLPSVYIASGKPDEAAYMLMEAESIGKTRAITTILSELLMEDRCIQPSDSKVFANALEAKLVGKDQLVNCRLALAGLYLDCNRPEKATPLIDAVLSKVNDQWAISSVASLANNHKAWQLSVNLLKRAVAIDPGNYDLRSYLARVYTHSGRKPEAVDVARGIVKDWSNGAWPLFYAGAALSEAGQYDEAIKVLQKAMAVGNSSSDLSPESLKGLQYSCNSTIARINEQRKNAITPSIETCW